VNTVKEFMKMVDHFKDEEREERIQGESGIRVVKGGDCNDGSSLE
jgi:hypothetical protein